MSAQNTVKKYTVAGMADVLGCFGIPTSTAMQFYNDVLEKRSREAMEILLKEIRHGDFSKIEKDHVVSVIARYQRDAMEGVAKNNLRLMARIINGMSEKEKLKAPSFLKYENILASLTEDEIFVLSMMCEDACRPRNTLDGMKSQPLLQDNPGSAKLKKELPHYVSVQQSLLRTGLLVMGVVTKTEHKPRSDVGQAMMYSGGNEPDFDIAATSTSSFKITPLMLEILEYVPKF